MLLLHPQPQRCLLQPTALPCCALHIGKLHESSNVYDALEGRNQPLLFMLTAAVYLMQARARF